MRYTLMNSSMVFSLVLVSLKKDLFDHISMAGFGSTEADKLEWLSLCFLEEPGELSYDRWVLGLYATL